MIKKLSSIFKNNASSLKKLVKKVIKNNIRYLVPTLIYDDLTSIPLSKFKELGVDTILLDLDNTLLPWNKKNIPQKVYNYLSKMKKNNFKLCIVSNALPPRVKKISYELDIPFVALAIKPSTRPLRKAIKMLNSSIEKTVIIGDQLFTDILAGNRLGIKTILVKPITKFELFTSKLLRFLEKLIINYIIRKKYTIYEKVHPHTDKI